MHVGRRRTFRTVAAGAALLMGGTFLATIGATPAGSAPPGVEPKAVTAVLAPGGSTAIKKTITTPEQPPKLDVYFLSDTTGSMSPTLANVQTNTAAILAAVSGGSPDVRFGAGNYKDFACDAVPFNNQAPIPAADDGGAAATAAIAAGSADGGCDTPESALFALHSLAAGGASFRSGATPVIVWFGDAPSHDPICASVTGASADVTEASATADLTGADVKVIAVSVDSGPGLDGDPTLATPYSGTCPVGGAAGQAQRITAATGGVEFTGVDPGDVTDAILNGLAALDVAVSPSVVCDPGLSLSFDAPSKTVTSGTDATFTETATVAPGASAGSTLHCTVDWLLNGDSSGDAFVQQVDVKVVAAKINKAGGPMCADNGKAVRVDLVVKPRSGTTVVGVVDAYMALTKIEKAPNAWLVHLKASSSSIPAHTATVTVHTDFGDLALVVDIPAYTCARVR